MKVADNIYLDTRCKHHPYSLNIMRNGNRLSMKCKTFSEAEERRDAFIRRNNKMPTEDPDVFKLDGRYIIEITIYREYDDYDKAVEKAKILRKFSKVS